MFPAAEGTPRSTWPPNKLNAPDRFLPVAAPLQRLIPGGGLRRGSVVAVARGDTSLLLALLAGASAAGSWCAVVGRPELGLVAAAEAGVSLERLALVPHPGPEWTTVVAALLDGFDVVAAATPERLTATAVSRLAARARRRTSVLVSYGRWSGADLTLSTAGGAWHGLSRGRGRLHRREVEIVVSGRGAGSRQSRARLWLPAGAPDEIPTPVETRVEASRVEVAAGLDVPAAKAG